MITFEQLNITPDGKHLIIEAKVDDFDYFDNVEIDSVVIDSHDTYVPNGPSSNPIYIKTYTTDKYDKTYSVPIDPCDPVLVEEDYDYCYTEGEQKVRSIKLILNQNDLGVSLNNTMLFVYIIVKGYPSPDTPCGYDNSKVMGVVVNLHPYYQKMINGIKEIDNTCNIPKTFIDNILRFKAVELSIKTCNYILAIKYWKKFFMSDNTGVTNKPCGCYGRNN